MTNDVTMGKPIVGFLGRRGDAATRRRDRRFATLFSVIEPALPHGGVR
jgi:hypothetical protein